MHFHAQPIYGGNLLRQYLPSMAKHNAFLQHENSTLRQEIHELQTELQGLKAKVDRHQDNANQLKRLRRNVLQTTNSYKNTTDGPSIFDESLSDADQTSAVMLINNYRPTTGGRGGSTIFQRIWGLVSKLWGGELKKQIQREALENHQLEAWRGAILTDVHVNLADSSFDAINHANKTYVPRKSFLMNPSSSAISRFRCNFMDKFVDTWLCGGPLPGMFDSFALDPLKLVTTLATFFHFEHVSRDAANTYPILLKVETDGNPTTKKRSGQFLSLAIPDGRVNQGYIENYQQISCQFTVSNLVISHLYFMQISLIIL